MNDLLKILNENGLELSKDCRTLLKTPRRVQNVIQNVVVVTVIEVYKKEF